MTINKLFKRSLITTIPAGLVLLASFTTTITLSSQPLQNSQTTVSTPKADLPVQTDTIDIEKTSKTNWNWPNNIYQGNEGYSFTNIENKDTRIFTIDKKGFIVNNSYPIFTKKQSKVKSNSGLEFVVSNLPESVNLNIYQQQFNSGTGFGGLNLVTSRAVTFGDSNNDTFAGWPNYSLSFSSPYLKFDIPVADYIINRTTGAPSGCQFERQSSYHEGRNHLWSNGTNRYRYGGRLEYHSEITKSEHQSPIGDVNVTHYHTLYKIQYVKISVYNDYDPDGKYLNTYLLDASKNFNSSLPTIQINESLLDKKVNALRNNTNIENLVELSGAQAIPSITNGTVTATKDVAAGSITFNYKPSFIFSNGTLQKYTGSGVSKVIEGFSLLNTYILSKAGYSDVIVVDRFINSIRKDDIIDPEELDKYLDLSSVPPGSSYSILESSIKVDLVKGTIEFQINASNGYNYDDTLSGETTPYYTVGLQLTPRITKIGYTGHLDDVLVSQYYNRVFDQTGLVNLDEFNKYAEIIAPVDNANYYLVPDSYDIHTGDGTASFKIYADKFYNSNADETVGGIDVVDSHFSVILNLKPLDSIMQVKSSYATDIRVDKFVASLGTIGADGVIADPTTLKQYINLENIPSTAQYKISNIDYADFNKQFIRNDIIFDLTVTAFNQADGTVTPQTKTLTLTLGDQHMTTDIVLLDASLFPKDATPSKFKARMEKDGAVDTNGTLTLTTANIEFLSKFLDFNSIPKDTVYTFTYNPVAPIDATEKLGFSLVINQYYDANSDLLTIPKAPYDFVLDLASEDYIPDPTILVTHAGSPVVNTEKDFLEQVYFDQKADLHNLSLYVDGLETIPTTADITIIKHQDSYNKVATFMIEVSGYYDGESSQMQTTAKAFNFNVNVNVDMNPDPFSWWWWLVIAIGVAGIIALLIWIPMHKWKEIKESDLL